jgi:hypothetical protein
MKKVFCLLVAISFIFVFASCSLLNSSTTPSGPAASAYPDSVVYKIKLSSEIYLCSGYKVSNTDTGISLQLNDLYSMSSDGKIIWIGKEKDISAVTIEKVYK